MIKMMIMIKTKGFIILFLTMIFLSVNGQEDRFKEFGESHKDRAFCFYPSTLRMINIGDIPEFNNMVNGIDKLLVYTLDSISGADKLYKQMLSDYKTDGYEEYISVQGGGNDMYLLGNEMQSKDNEFVGVVINNELSLTFYMRGDIGWEEIPKMINTIQNGDFIDILDFKFVEFD
jgi:hypothetical protein